MPAAAQTAAALAACPHFTLCGGCANLPPKHDLLPAALRLAGYPTPPCAPLAASPPRSRRRMDLAVRRTAAGVELGLHRRRSHDIVDLHHCEVLHPELTALFDPLRDLLNRLDLLRRTASAVANRLDNGIDLLLRSDAAASRHDRARLADFARAHGLARISHARGAEPPEPVAVLRPPVVCFSGVAVTPPPGAFLQATAEGQEAIVAAVIAALPPHLPHRARIAELYAGCGTLTFPLSHHARIDAFEGEPTALAALAQAARARALIGRIVPTLRDLARQPLPAKQLAAYAAVVMDPPAGGAPLQIAHIAASTVPRIIYVSCNPASLATDATTLRRAGYRLVSATPIDQFIGTPRIESVVVFSRGRSA